MYFIRCVIGWSERTRANQSGAWLQWETADGSTIAQFSQLATKHRWFRDIQTLVKDGVCFWSSVMIITSTLSTHMNLILHNLVQPEPAMCLFCLPITLNKLWNTGSDIISPEWWGNISSFSYCSINRIRQNQTFSGYWNKIIKQIFVCFIYMFKMSWSLDP